MQVVLVYLEWFRRNSVLKCVLQPKIAKNATKNPYFGGSWSFKVIDIGTTGKLVGSACTKSTSLKTRDTRQSRLSHSEDLMILSFVVLTQYSSVTDGQTDRPVVRPVDLNWTLTRWKHVPLVGFHSW